MPAPSEFQYTILRIVPSLDRGERINVGVVVFCAQRNYLEARVEVNRARLAMLSTLVDPDEVAIHLSSLSDLAAGRTQGGALATLPPSQRFGWLSSPSSTAIQPSRVHTGLTQDPAATLEQLFTTLVRTPKP